MGPDSFYFKMCVLGIKLRYSCLQDKNFTRIEILFLKSQCLAEFWFCPIIFWIEQLYTKKWWFWKKLIRHENLSIYLMASASFVFVHNLLVLGAGEMGVIFCKVHCKYVFYLRVFVIKSIFLLTGRMGLVSSKLASFHSSRRCYVGW